MATDIEKLEKVTLMYRAYMHMRHGKDGRMADVQSAIDNLQEGEILRIQPEGGYWNAQEAD